MQSSNRQSRAVVSLLWVCWALLSTLVSGQGLSVITGRVADTSGGVIVDARVTVTGAGGVIRRISTDARGEFRAGGLPAGDYLVRVDRPQFRSVVVTVRLDGSAPGVDLPVVLSAAGVSERVAVTGREAPYADPETTTAGKVSGPRRRVANSVSVLTREQMNDQNMVNTWDALSQEAGRDEYLQHFRRAAQRQRRRALAARVESPDRPLTERDVAID